MSGEPRDTHDLDRRLAIGVRYDEDEQRAPRVVAKGRGEVADRILEAAEAAGVPVREDHDLAQLLAAVELGDEIPAEAYMAVAQVISFLWRLNEEAAG